MRFRQSGELRALGSRLASLIQLLKGHLELARGVSFFVARLSDRFGDLFNLIRSGFRLVGKGFSVCGAGPLSRADCLLLDVVKELADAPVDPIEPDGGRHISR
ncbi:Uncharacterised protein [Mycobacteroides abscessus subsp. abscessus]|nr:Uncharacterised protein [Mycobacteroides abscessus subsp. abscessus]